MRISGGINAVEKRYLNLCARHLDLHKDAFNRLVLGDQVVHCFSYADDDNRGWGGLICERSDRVCNSTARHLLQSIEFIKYNDKDLAITDQREKASQVVRGHLVA